MALQQDYNYNGIIIKDAYFKIVGFTCKKIGTDYWYYPRVNIWANKIMSSDETKVFRNILDKQSFILVLEDADNIVARLYNELANTTEYENSIEV